MLDPEPLEDLAGPESVPEGWNTDYHVHRWQAGDEEAFPALERHFRPLLVSRARRNPAWPDLSRRCEAEDVVRDVWAQVVRYAGRSFTSSGGGSFTALLRMLCDRTLDVRVEDPQGSRRGGSRPGAAADEPPASGGRREEVLALAERILSDRELLAWLHVDLQGYTFEEVGDLVLECSASDVRELLMRARAQLEPLV